MKKNNLNTKISENTPFWHTLLPEGEPVKVENDLIKEADVVVIGAGLTGISTAFHLLKNKPDLKVQVLEARGLCDGATGRNGGHQFGEVTDNPDKDSDEYKCA